LHQGLAALGRQQRAARVGKILHCGVEQFRRWSAGSGQQIGKGFGLQALLVHGNGQDAACARRRACSVAG
jgi:hypothetical protein